MQNTTLGTPGKNEVDDSLYAFVEQNEANFIQHGRLSEGEFEARILEHFTDTSNIQSDAKSLFPIVIYLQDGEPVAWSDFEMNAAYIS